MTNKFSKNPYFRQATFLKRRRGGREEVRNAEGGARTPKVPMPMPVECAVCGGVDGRHDGECPLWGRKV